ncbi:hypothetical protein RYX36_023537 [Vicia faba]
MIHGGVELKKMVEANRRCKPKKLNLSLVEQERWDEARRVLEKVRGTKIVDAEFEDLKDASELAQAVKSLFEILIKRNYKP